MKRNIVIELNEQVSKELSKTQGKFATDLFKSESDLLETGFELIHANVIFDALKEKIKNELMALVMTGKVDTPEYRSLNRVHTELCNSVCKTIIKRIGEEFKITSYVETSIKRINEGLFISFHYNKALPIPMIDKVGELVEDNTLVNRKIAYDVMQLLVNTVDYLERPTTVKFVDEIRVPKKTSQGSKKRKNGVKYVYKTVYKVKEVTNPTGRQNREREYYKETWERKGHKRVYRDKSTGKIVKEVWIKPATCHAKGKIKEQQTLRITKVND